MQTLRRLLIVVCAFGLLLPAVAQAQVCPNPITINCGDSVAGDSSGGANNIEDYSCISFSETGLEAYYVLTLTEAKRVTASAAPNPTFDAAIAILPDASGDCDPAACIAGADGGNPETTSADLTPGTYYIVVDGYNGANGPFDLTVTCESCTDADMDGFNAFDAVDCPTGDDCCDVGDEGGPGCDAGEAPNINPDATETCDDGIDQDCDGLDLPCNPTCMADTTVACLDVLAGNNGAAGSTNFFTSYTCQGGNFAGPEFAYSFTPSESGLATIEVEAATGFDPGLMIIEELGNDCIPDDCIAGADDTSSGGTESIVDLPVTAGTTYYIIVEGWGTGASNTGDYTLRIICAEDCSDADGDGFNGMTASCPSGDDCCDAGDEGGPGCTAGEAANINPDVSEICGDGTDQDCDGEDPACPNCGSDATIACNDSGTIDTATQGNANIDDYCNGFGASNGVDWSGSEYIFGYTPASDILVTFNIANTTVHDIFLMTDFGDSTVCNPDGCVDIGGAHITSGPLVKGILSAGESYFISVDGLNGDNGTFDYDMACEAPGTCVPDEDIACTDAKSGDTTGLDDDVGFYTGIPWDMPGPEYVYTFTNAIDAEVTVDLTMANGLDLGLIAIADNGDGCYANDTVAASDIDNPGNNDFTEQVTFSTTTGTTYYIVVDSWQTTEFGTYDLTVGCAVDCTGDLLDCGTGECLDVTADPDHCGSCDPCDLPNTDTHDCFLSTCEVLTCDTGFDDCDFTDANGCEINLLSDPANCGACGSPCGVDEVCNNGTCQEGCTLPEIDCGGSCVNPNTSLEHCGGCDNACTVANGTPVCNAGTCEIESCDTGFADCDTEYDTGCEAALNTVTNCGACGIPCAHDNAASDCSTGACVMGDCDAGFTDCNADDSDGCEANTAADPANCGACDNPCDYANATPMCNAGVCEMGACLEGFGDCDADDTNGCEVNTAADHDNCGACDNACDPDQVCSAGVCQLDCDAGLTDCGGSCVDLSTDEAHCGACDTPCDAGAGCYSGACCEDNDGDGAHSAKCGGTDCNDEDRLVSPDEEEICDGKDQDCDGIVDDGFDMDGDGYTSCGDAADCDDNDAGSHPGATEICGDGVDQDCSGRDDTCPCPDADNDGYFDANCAEGGDDCDDNDPNVNPGAGEVCKDQIDNDCNGTVDDEAVCDTAETCGCASKGDGAASGALLLLFVLGLAWVRRR